MVGVGLAWTLNSLGTVEEPIPFMIGIAFGNLWIVLLYVLLLTFPEGRLRSARDRTLGFLALLSAVLLQIPALLFLRLPDSEVCPECASNPLLIADERGVTEAIFGLQRVVGFIAVAALLVILYRNWRDAAPAQRPALRPVLWAGGATFLVLAVQLGTLSVEGDSDASQAIFLLAALPFLTVPYAFLFGLLRTRLSRDASVGRLLERLRGAGVEGGSLRDALSEALADPSLELVYWLPEQGTYADESGAPVDIDALAPSRLVRVVRREGEPVGALICDPALAEQTTLVDAVGAAASLALANERLEAALRARVDELRASRARLVQTADTERRRLERDLHDGAQQRLVALALSLRLARGRVRSDPGQAEELLDEAMAELDQATAELRELARGIHPAILSDRGLRAALEALAGRSPVPVEIDGVPEERLSAEVEAAAYFVVAEGLTNVARYAEASRATIAVARAGGDLVVSVSDDGRGGADPQDGSGLGGLADRVAVLDGRLAVDSPAGEGTRLTATIPCG
jgi:signal transduction histidine kinase